MAEYKTHTINVEIPIPPGRRDRTTYAISGLQEAIRAIQAHGLPSQGVLLGTLAGSPHPTAMIRCGVELHRD